MTSSCTCRACTLADLIRELDEHLREIERAREDLARIQSALVKQPRLEDAARQNLAHLASGANWILSDLRAYATHRPRCEWEHERPEGAVDLKPQA